jgi:hypothetical protein
MSFNVLSRRAGVEDATYLATRMQFNEADQRVGLERFKVLNFPEALVVERAELNLAKRIISVDLFRKRPTFCGLHLEGGKDWEFVFETKELCRSFAKGVKGILCLDGEFHAEDENAAGFQVVVNASAKATLLVVGSSVFMRLKPTESKFTASAWRELSTAHWTRQLEPNELSTIDELGEPLTVEFRERSARERFLALRAHSYFHGDLERWQCHCAHTARIGQKLARLGLARRPEVLRPVYICFAGVFQTG